MSSDLSSMLPSPNEQLYLDLMRMYTKSIMSDVTLIVHNSKNFDHADANNNNNNPQQQQQQQAESSSVSFACHRCVLSARCDFFCKMFNGENENGANWAESDSAVVHLTDIEPEDFRVLIEYFYSAKINVDASNAFGVLKLADEFGVELVKQYCVQYVKNLVTHENVFDVLEQSMYHNFEELYQFCLSHVAVHAKQLFMDGDPSHFCRMDKMAMMEVLRDDRIMAPEIVLFLSVIQWGKYQVKLANNNRITMGDNYQNNRKKKQELSKRLVLRKKQRPTQEISMDSLSGMPTISTSSPWTEGSGSVTIGVDRAQYRDVAQLPIVRRSEYEPIASGDFDNRNDNSNGRSNQQFADASSGGRQSQTASSSHGTSQMERALSPSELHVTTILSRSPASNSRSSKKSRRRAQSDINDPHILSISEASEFDHTASEMTDLSIYDEEEGDLSPRDSLATEDNGGWAPVDSTCPRHLSNLLNLTIMSSSSIIEPLSHSSLPTAFHPPDMSQIKKTYSQIIDYVQDKSFVKQLSVVVADLMDLVRFPTLDPHELYEYVEPSLVVPKMMLLEAYRAHALSNRMYSPSKSPRAKVRDGSLFYMPGVLENVPIKILKGWTCIYQQPYSHATTASIFEPAMSGTRIMLAARHKNSSRLALCAMGRVSVVLRETKENETTYENGVYFYNWKGRSVGFSADSNINLGTADLSSGLEKLSWHLTGRGGYRCGELTKLNDSTEWEKLVFFS